MKNVYFVICGFKNIVICMHKVSLNRRYLLQINGQSFVKGFFIAMPEKINKTTICITP